MKKKSLLQKIYKIHSKHLKYLNIPHKKLIIAFSGVPASGKTHIAKIIEEYFQAVRINNDDIRSIIAKFLKKRKTQEDPQTILQNYLLFLLKEKFKTWKNRLVILDSSIDRKYETIKKAAEQEKFPLFIIALQVHHKTLKKRIKKRGKQAQEHFHKEIKRWAQEYKAFNKKFKSDILLKGHENKDLKIIFRKLDAKIK